ncbi:MAG TPA: hypothetical protein PK867_13610, partial [Pirellulales bacterium]|nr:hypothetical protein [Pirellulales bacterium]
MSPRLTLISCTISAIVSIWVATPLAYLLSRFQFRAPVNYTVARSLRERMGSPSQQILDRQIVEPASAVPLAEQAGYLFLRPRRLIGRRARHLGQIDHGHVAQV